MYIKIIFGTGGGNTEITCQKIKETFEELGHKVDLLRAKTSAPSDMLGSDLLVLASPTYGHGLLEEYMAKFIGAADKSDLSGVKAVVVGLGSPVYDLDYFIESEKILAEFLVERNAEIVHEPLKISKCPLPYLKNIVPEWVRSVNKVL